MLRTVLAYLCAPVMHLTGFRFSKRFRRGETRAHRVAFRLVDTVAANRLAGLSPRARAEADAMWRAMQERLDAR